MEKWKSNNRIPLSHAASVPLSKSKRKEFNSGLILWSFRLILELENA
jgi:hypothetical protein